MDKHEAEQIVTREVLARMRDDRMSDWPTRLLKRMGRATVAKLSPGETRVLEALSYGMTKQMVADTYGVSVETVKTQLAKAQGKLGAKNTVQAVAVALRCGYIT